MKRFIFFLVAIVLFCAQSGYAIDKNLYIVKLGDTLWDLSKSHYKDPFLWGKIWINNAYINDPNLIFPGEVIQFTKHGITIYKKQPKIVKKAKKPHLPIYKKYDTAVFFDGEKYYSDCTGGFCIWDKDAFNIGNLDYDKYNHIEAEPGMDVYIKTKKPLCVKKFYVYRKMVDRLSVSICPNEPKVIYYPIAEIDVLKTIKPNLFKGRIIKASSEISPKDVVSLVYPYKTIPQKPCIAKLNKLPIQPMSIKDEGLTTLVGYYMFFRVPKAYWQIKKRANGCGYHIIKSPKPFIKNIVGCRVLLDRVNHNIPENTNIGEGVVVAQYKNYISIFFSTYNSKLTEMVDRTEEYILR
jgi:hypothetical protein